MTTRASCTKSNAGLSFWTGTLVGTCIATLCSVCPSTAHSYHSHISSSRVKEVKIKMSVGVVAGPSGLLPVRIDILRPGMGLTAGFGVKLFVDKVKVYTDLDATDSVHNCYLDLRQIGAGYHYVIANVCDHRDHIGVDSAWIKVSPSLREVTRYQQTPPELMERWKQGGTGWPGQYVVRPGPPDPAIESPHLQCCGRFTDWFRAAQGTILFYVLAP